MTTTDTERVEADQLAETSLTVNGQPVRLRLPPRVTLADALRDHLRLTGTHLGCEHGVCGMCTVLVDGRPPGPACCSPASWTGPRSTTVEGLGRPETCTRCSGPSASGTPCSAGSARPAFLLSAYDLLSRRPDVPPDALPAELSGVLCRCTGYRNILAAVQEVAAAHRDGSLPGPGNCAPAVSSLVEKSPAGPPPRLASGGDGPEPEQVTLPSGPPTFTTTVTSTLAVPPAAVWRVLSDVHRVAQCLPGAELTEDLGDDRYRGRARVGVGPVRLSFRGLAQVTGRDEASRTLRVLAHGRDTGGAQTQAAIEVRAEPDGDGCRLTAEARVYLTGRIAQFGRALAGDVSRRLFEQFAAAVQQAATTGATPQRPPASPSAFRLLLGALADRLRALGRRR